MIFIMALPKGTKRYKHNVTGEIRYFKNAPNLSFWTKVGTPGSKNWRWINTPIPPRAGPAGRGTGIVLQNESQGKELQ